MIHTLENDALRVSVADAGAELVGVYDKTRNAERLWTGDAAVWNRHAPILFPFVGRVMDGKYRVSGREYPMPTQHGFARDRVFECVQATGDSVTHRLTADEGTRAVYPYDFALTVAHRLDGRRLHVTWTVENRGQEEMFFSIGGHPGFLPPAGVKKEDCEIVFPGAQELWYRSVNAAGYALPEVRELALKDGRAGYQSDIPDTWIFEDGQVKTVGLAEKGKAPFVTLHCEAFPMLAVWANPKGPFICLEPWFGHTDDVGFAGSIHQKKAVQRLEAGKKRTIEWDMDF